MVKEVPMMIKFIKFFTFVLGLTSWLGVLDAAEDFFKKYAGVIPVKVHYTNSASTRPMNLRGIDSARGIIYAERIVVQSGERGRIRGRRPGGISGI